ncbi:MAG: ferritin family protein [Tissierellia bacterium]|nr:ferritin family protein [Tissierellia bacterium]
MDTPQRIIRYAMEMELYGHNFYKENAEKNLNLQTKNIFERLSGVEYEHYKYLKKLLDKYTEDKVIDDTIKLPKEENIFDNVKKEENLDKNLEESMIPDMNVLRMAYLIEEDFRDFYSNMSKKVEDEKLKKILEDFATWEDGHYKLFKGKYNELMDKYMSISWGG